MPNRRALLRSPAACSQERKWLIPTARIDLLTCTRISPLKARGRPPEGDRPNVVAPASADRPHAHGTRHVRMISPIPDASRELPAWQAAVEHLHSLGLPAAVPEVTAAHLRRRGVTADWTVAA